MEKVYNSMKISGGACITIGCIMIVVGVTCGILSIVAGGKLLVAKNKIEF